MGLASLPAATITLGTSTPGAGDGITFIGGSTGDGDNTDHDFVASDYLGNHNQGLDVGQSFTTGANVGGYLLSSISVRQVSWASDYDYTGGDVTLRFFDSSGGFFPSAQMASQTVSIDPGVGGDVVTGGAPTLPMWLTFTFDAPIALDANKLYAFVFHSTGTSSNDGFFMNLDGTSNGGAYTGGSSITADNTSNLWNGNSSGDRTFVATMAAVPEPSVALLGGLGLLGLLRRRR